MTEKDEEYLLKPFSIENREIELFGYALDLTGQAIQHFIAFGDFKATKKKFGATRKLPKTLRQV
jgi:hypothetical protein